MSFTIHLSPDCKSTRSRLSSGLIFSPHPLSSFHPDPPHSPTAEPLTLQVKKHLCSGYLWDFWLAHHPTYGKVIFIVLYVPEWPCNEPDTWEYIPYEKIIDEVKNEEEIYLEKLRDLQGTVVPNYHGFYRTSDDLHWAIILQNAGYALGPGLATLDEEWKGHLYRAYETIHLHGVHHGDIDTRHILFCTKPQNHIVLVGFRRSSKADMTVGKHVRSLMMEMLDVRRRIGYGPGAQVKLHLLPATYYSRVKAEDREEFMQSISDQHWSEVSTPEEIRASNQEMLNFFPPSHLFAN
ncbi:hypothetical protein I302_100662 [Kwoniella bestiolae CBS 10118]|uniref:Protein kinase domain-containing protein n=1 Tax=Kwoniella bestiolae CBS 10118 TaxID=1296100 RepID=A0A1B9G5P2_9TREE|nr:hypothetical protein I302_04037 [Kwoniella bestiolae CBS 10118]OCF26354.1 hypothetical protein I302_04037 [Kwoniella bestiolae CBS 10118]